MSTFPAFSGTRLIQTLKRFGFEVVRIKGSHHFLSHPDGRCTVVPVHRGETIGGVCWRKSFAIARSRGKNFARGGELGTSGAAGQLFSRQAREVRQGGRPTAGLTTEDTEGHRGNPNGF